MIRRLAITILLLAVGFAVLHYTIGFENFTRSGAGGGGTSPILESSGNQRNGAETDEGSGRRSGGGVVVGDIEGGEGEAAIAVTGSGATRFRNDEEHPQPDGTIHYTPLWILDAKDSETVDEDVMRLLDVTLTVHRVVPGRPGTPPDSEPIGTATAREAVVSVGRDEEGRPSIDQDREMDLFGVRLVADGKADSAVRDIELRVARLRVRHGATGLEFRTPSPAEPFELTLGGDDPMEVTGHGIEGKVPPRGEAGELELRVRTDPTIVRGASRMHADGELLYVEDPSSGFGRLTMQDRVRVLGVGLDPQRAATTATGDRLSGVLVRYRNVLGGASASHGAAWRSLRLTGRPARLSQLGGSDDGADGAALEILSKTLHISPDPAGNPWLFTAEGTPVVLDARSGARFEAADRIHVADPRVLLGDLFGAYGIRPRFPALVGVLLLFEGESRIVDAERQLEVTAAAGLRILRGNEARGAGTTDRRDLASEPLIAVGRGAVHIVREQLDVTGTDGFELRLHGEEVRLRLGPPDAGVEHTYALTQTGKDQRKVTVRGSGSCRVQVRPDGTADLDLDSPDRSVVLESTEGTLRDLGQLHAELDAEGRPTLLDARGRRCAFDATFVPSKGKPAERVSGVASHLLLRGPELELDGGSEAAVLIRGTDRVEGSRIVMDRLDRERGTVRVERFADGRPARVRAKVPDRDGKPVRESLVLEADALHAYPDLVPPWALAFHGLPLFAGTMLRSEVVFARGNAVVRRLDAEDRRLGSARGDLLVFLPSLERGVLFGDPEGSGVAEVENQDERGRRSVGRAPEIRVAATGGVESLTFELRPGGSKLPEIDVFGGDPGDDDAFRNARLLCDGVIRNTGDTLSLDGPVQIRGLTALGELDPSGVSMSADRLDLVWDPRGRTIRRVLASKGATFRFRDFLASGERVELDATTSRASVQSGGDDPARLELGGQKLTGAWFEANYRTLEYKAFAVRLGDATAGPSR